jgi:hypothetical protein
VRHLRPLLPIHSLMGRAKLLRLPPLDSQRLRSQARISLSDLRFWEPRSGARRGDSPLYLPPLTSFLSSLLSYFAVSEGLDRRFSCPKAQRLAEDCNRQVCSRPDSTRHARVPSTGLALLPIYRGMWPCGTSGRDGLYGTAGSRSLRMLAVPLSYVASCRIVRSRRAYSSFDLFTSLLLYPDVSHSLHSSRERPFTNHSPTDR